MDTKVIIASIAAPPAFLAFSTTLSETHPPLAEKGDKVRDKADQYHGAGPDRRHPQDN
jgi:hypothetical protein